MSSLDSMVVDFVRESAGSDRYAAYLRNTLMDLLAINTSPGASITDVSNRERQMFEWMAREISDVAGAEAVIEQAGIDSAIADDPDYSPPIYAANENGVVPPEAKVYADRSNLVAILRGGNGADRPAVILHAAIDVATPWFLPRSAGERVHGCGACESRAQMALLLAQMKLLREVEERFGSKPTGSRVYQFVIDEQIGGNGSLSLASDARFAKTPVLMHACTDLRPHGANPAVVEYRCRLSVGKNTGTSAVELFPFVVQELEAEGRRLKEASSVAAETGASARPDSVVFTPEHVQTHHGILGCFGSSPTTVCDHVAIEIFARAKANPERIGMKMIEFMDEALDDYVQIYGDKTRQTDPATGKPKVERHFELKVLPRPDVVGVRIDVWGKRGHMAALNQCDSAITKAAYLFGSLLRVAGSFPGIQATARLADGGRTESREDDHAVAGSSGSSSDEKPMILEGAQSFSPGHAVSDVQARLVAAAKRGLQQYCQIRGRQYDESMVDMTFDRRQTDLYADSSDADSAKAVGMQALKTAFGALGEPWPGPTAWPAGGTAGIYHHKGHDVSIFGAGKLESARSADEYIDIPDIQKALAVSTLATWSMIQ